MKVALGKVVLYQINAGKKEGAALKKHYGVKGGPAFVLTDGAEKTYGTWTGFKKNEKFINSLAKAMPPK